MHHRLLLTTTVTALSFAFALKSFAASPIQERADRFLALANAGFQGLYRVNSEAATEQTSISPPTFPSRKSQGDATGLEQ